jgi:hypothetical protein
LKKIIFDISTSKLSKNTKKKIKLKKQQSIQEKKKKTIRRPTTNAASSLVTHGPNTAICFFIHESYWFYKAFTCELLRKIKMQRKERCSSGSYSEIQKNQ